MAQLFMTKHKCLSVVLVHPVMVASAARQVSKASLNYAGSPWKPSPATIQYNEFRGMFMPLDSAELANVSYEVKDGIA